MTNEQTVQLLATLKDIDNSLCCIWLIMMMLMLIATAFLFKR